MKKVIICVMLFSTLLYGCAAQSSDKNSGSYVDNFVRVESAYNSGVYVDKNTKVMYWRSGSGLTVIFNADGTPMLWEGELE